MTVYTAGSVWFLSLSKPMVNGNLSPAQLPDDPPVLQQPTSYLPIPTSLLPPIIRCRSQVCSLHFLLSFWLMSIVGKVFQTLHIHSLFVSVCYKSDRAGFLKRIRFGRIFFNGEEESEHRSTKAEHQMVTTHHSIPQFPFNISPHKLQRHSAPSSPPLWHWSLNSSAPISIWKRRSLKWSEG